MDRKTTYIE